MPSGFSDQQFLFSLVSHGNGDGVCRVLSVLFKYEATTGGFILCASKQGMVSRLYSSQINSKISLMNKNVHMEVMSALSICVMLCVQVWCWCVVTVVSYWWSHSRCWHRCRPSLRPPALLPPHPPGQITSAQVIPSDRPKLNWHQQNIFQNDCGIINTFMVLYYNIDFLCYNMGNQMHAITIGFFFLIGWIVIYHRISDNFGKVEFFFYIEMINMYVLICVHYCC